MSYKWYGDDSEYYTTTLFSVIFFAMLIPLVSVLIFCSFIYPPFTCSQGVRGHQKMCIEEMWSENEGDMIKMMENCANVMTTWGLIRPPFYFQGNLRTSPKQDGGNLCRKWKTKDGGRRKYGVGVTDPNWWVSQQERLQSGPNRVEQTLMVACSTPPYLPPLIPLQSTSLPPSFPPLSNPCPSPRRHRPLPPEVGGGGEGGGGGGVEGNVALHKKLVVVKVLEDTVCVCLCVCIRWISWSRYSMLARKRNLFMQIFVYI